MSNVKLVNGTNPTRAFDKLRIAATRGHCSVSRRGKYNDFDVLLRCVQSGLLVQVENNRWTLTATGEQAYRDAKERLDTFEFSLR